MKFGRLAPVASPHALMFERYTQARLPQPSLGYSNIYTVEDKLALAPTDVYDLFPMDGNDSLGDCTCAGMAHAQTIYNGMLGRKQVATVDLVTSTYKGLTGGPDTGLACTTVLDYWKTDRFNGEKILGYMALDVHNHTQVQQAIEFFGGVYLGFNVQESCLNDFNSNPKIPWTPGPSTNDGHCVFATAYSQQYLRVLTWGSSQLATWAWWDAQVEEAYVILPVEAMQPGFVPGFNYQMLQADLASL